MTETAQEYLTLKELAAKFKMSIHWARKHAREGTFKTSVIGGRVRVPISEVERLEKEFAAQGVKP